MIINSVRLKNIRSYLDETIEFPDGTTLLSGDIGCGKSSILLAIEFALFGIMRGSLSGGALLRHGKNEGSVELNAKINGKEVVIFRSLKKSKENIVQDVGYIIIGEEKFEGTPVELKAKIIEMIGYPDELVSKSKSLIFRYTVYTPQEEMKNILFEGEESRLDTLRKIFNIDKYKRIKENSAILARELRSEKKHLKSSLEDLEEIKQRVSEKKDKKKSAETELKKLRDELRKAKKYADEAKERVSEAEKKSHDYNNLKKELENVNANLEEREGWFEDEQEDLESMREEVKELEKELKDVEIKTLEPHIKKGEAAIEKLEEDLSVLREKEAKYKEQRNQANEIKEEIDSLDECPLCKQNVTKEHASDVKKKQDKKIEEIKKKLLHIEEVRKQLDSKISEYKNKVSDLREKEKKLAGVKEKAKRLDDKKKSKEKAEKEIKKLQAEIKELKQKKIKIKSNLEKIKDVSKLLDEAKENYDAKQESLKKLEIEEASFSKELESLDEALEELEGRLTKLKKGEEKLRKINESLQWIDEYFVKVIDVMEKQVMLRIYSEFNEYFVEWFNTLMEDETLSVRLDETFSPVIIQDGYETNVENLSGGEKTSVALAYRLSLNKVINDFISTIKTKDLIILDEPTDGFSSEQLDRVREVLNQLNIAQIIIVSHEPKMESYVNNVIRVEKYDNKSRVGKI